MGWRVCPGFQTVPSSNDVGCTDFCAKPSGWNIGLDTYTRHSKMVGKENWKKGQHFLFLFLSYRQQNHMPAWDTSYFSEFMSVFEKHYLVQDLKKKTKPKSEMYLLSGHCDPIFGLRQSYKWQKEETLCELLLELWGESFLSLYKGEQPLRLVSTGRIICPSADPSLWGIHPEYAQYLTQHWHRLSSNHRQIWCVNLWRTSSLLL